MEVFASQLQAELGHYWMYACQSSAKLGETVPPTLSHQSSSRHSRSISRAPSGLSVCQLPQPPIAPSSAPSSALEGEGESGS